MYPWNYVYITRGSLARRTKTTNGQVFYRISLLSSTRSGPDVTIFVMQYTYLLLPPPQSSADILVYPCPSICPAGVLVYTISLSCLDRFSRNVGYTTGFLNMEWMNIDQMYTTCTKVYEVVGLISYWTSWSRGQLLYDGDCGHSFSTRSRWILTNLIQQVYDIYDVHGSDSILEVKGQGRHIRWGDIL